MTETVRIILHIAAILLTSILSALATAKICTVKWGGSFKKAGILSCIACAIIAASSVFLHTVGLRNIQTIFLFCVFLYAAYGDLMTHEADDFVHVLVLAVALMCKDPKTIPQSILSAVLMVGLMLLVAFTVKGADIGGADIKFTAACAFLTTLEGGLIGLCLGTFIALIFNSPFRKKEGAEEPFPMLPYLSCGYMFVFLLFNAAF
jgi:hypothetical protein